MAEFPADELRNVWYPLILVFSLEMCAEFAVVKGDKGLCNECLELVLRKEEKKDVDPNQVELVIPDKGTHGLLMLQTLKSYFI
ncbi:hypothetical protein WN943_010927 [Citrus x changshan-huyou]